MSETHTSYKVSKRLKEFLGDSAPEPMEPGWWVVTTDGGHTWPDIHTCHEKTDPPAYQLHDLLSKPFTKAMAKKICPKMDKDGFFDIEDYWDIALIILREYQSGNISAVEAALMEMMK